MIRINITFKDKDKQHSMIRINITFNDKDKHNIQ